MKCLVTGGAGFIGSNLVDKLVEKKNKVIVFDALSTGNASNLKKVRKKITFIKHDISKGVDKFERYFRNADWIFHLAGKVDIVPSITNPIQYFNSNVQGTLNILEIARKKHLKKFQRGVYFKKNIGKKVGEKINFKNVSFHFPLAKGQLAANDYSVFSDFKTKKTINKGNKLLIKDVKINNLRGKTIEIRNKVRDLATRANIVTPKYSRIEISHHYGLEKFFKYGLCMIVIINQSYCKKYLFLFKNQIHPSQLHKQKQETFLILFGTVQLDISFNNKRKKKIMKPGEIFTIKPGMIHKFKALSSAGAVIEEISTESIPTDSYYLDKNITKILNRKSYISFR